MRSLIGREHRRRAKVGQSGTSRYSIQFSGADTSISCTLWSPEQKDVVEPQSRKPMLLMRSLCFTPHEILSTPPALWISI